MTEEERVNSRGSWTGGRLSEKVMVEISLILFFYKTIYKSKKFGRVFTGETKKIMPVHIIVELLKTKDK